MTVQISVTLWTVLCFLALMLVLDRLLFRPLLSFMDKRREKIDAAREAKQTALREREEELRRREEERLSANRQAQTEAAAALEQIRQDSAQRLAEKKADSARQLEELRQQLKAESEAMIAAVEPHIGELAVSFAACIHQWEGQEETLPASAETAAPHAEIAPAAE